MSGIGQVDRLVITVLAEDRAGHGTQCWAQNGLALLITVTLDGTTKRILFDTGWRAEPILHNMEILDVNPALIDLVVLSHCHRDHTGGLLPMLERIGSQDLPVVCHPSVFRTQVVASRSADSTLWLMKTVGMPIGVTQNAMNERGARPVMLAEPAELMPGVVWSGEIPRDCPFEEVVTVPLYAVVDGHLVVDQMVDDGALAVIVRGLGLVVVCGCCHAGIVNTIEHLKRTTMVDQVCAVVGGLHLMDASQERIQKTVDALQISGSSRVFGGHCTGFKGEIALQQVFGDRFESLFCGKVIDSAGLANPSGTLRR